MKLIALNIWGGHLRTPLLEFIHSYQNVDIFCLQEVYDNACDTLTYDDGFVSLNILSELQALLPDHSAIFTPVAGETYGIAMFVKKNLDIVGQGDIIVHENPDYSGKGAEHSRKLQWIECRMDDQNYFILNLHGLWDDMGKIDSPARVAQSEKIREFLDSIDKPKILCGDFNLRPDTESIKILEKGMTNLIQTYKINSTRTSLYSKEVKYADYVLVSPEITVNNFERLMDEVSDHSPLFLDFGLPSLAEKESVLAVV